MKRSRPFHALNLGLILAVWFTLFAINPHDRSDWLLENALSVALIALLVLTRNVLPLSRLSYTAIFVYLMLHTLGAHYTYSLVPYDDWFAAVTGRTVSDLFGWERNHFDRLVHLCYGLLFVYPMRELFLRVADARGFWGYFLPLDLTLSTSAIYEIIEWGAAHVFGGELGTAYVGSQGDAWDAQKDMLLAGLGALTTTLIIVAVHARTHRDFAREFVESLRVKRPEPLDEPAAERAAPGEESSPRT